MYSSSVFDLNQVVRTALEVCLWSVQVSEVELNEMTELDTALMLPANVANASGHAVLPWETFHSSPFTCLGYFVIVIMVVTFVVLKL